MIDKTAIKLGDIILYQLKKMCQDILVDIWVFTLNLLNPVSLEGRRYLGNMRLALTDGSLKWELFSKVMLNLMWEKAFITSVKGWAADLVCFLGTNTAGEKKYF